MGLLSGIFAARGVAASAVGSMRIELSHSAIAQPRYCTRSERAKRCHIGPFKTLRAGTALESSRRRLVLAAAKVRAHERLHARLPCIEPPLPLTAHTARVALTLLIVHVDRRRHKW